MLIHLQFPIVDLRGLAGGEDPRLPVPSWPAPLSDEEFVRSMGMVRKRPRGGLAGWVAEEHYCDAHQSIKLDPETLGSPQLRKWNFRIAFRRFYFDGSVVAKFEIGFATREGFASPRQDNVNSLLAALLAMPVRIGVPGKKSIDFRLAEAGRALADLYASASNRHRWRGPLAWIRWRQRAMTSMVVAGTPAVFIEAAPWHIGPENLPDPVRTVPMKDDYLRLFYWRGIVDGRSFPVWTAVHPDYVEIAEARKLRLYLLRLNAENQALVRVLKAINSDQIKPQPRTAHSDTLQAYLHRATSHTVHLAAKSREFAVGNDKLLSLAAAAAETFLSAEERQSVLSHLEGLQIRKNLFRKIEAQETLQDLDAALRLDGTQHAITFHANTINVGGFHMSKDNEKLVAVLFGAAFLVGLLVLAIVFPQPTSFQYTVFRIVLAVSAAGFVSMTPGFINVSIGKWLRAGGALGVFAVVYFFSPAALVANP